MKKFPKKFGEAVIGSYSDFLVYDPDGVGQLDGKPKIYPEWAEETAREALGCFWYTVKPHNQESTT
jgi:hypothetical protein